MAGPTRADTFGLVVNLAPAPPLGRPSSRADLSLAAGWRLQASGFRPRLRVNLLSINRQPHANLGAKPSLGRQGPIRGRMTPARICHLPAPNGRAGHLLSHSSEQSARLGRKLGPFRPTGPTCSLISFLAPPRPPDWLRPARAATMGPLEHSGPRSSSDRRRQDD